MRYHWHDIPAFLRTPLGRMQLRDSVYQASWPLLSRLASLYRRTLVKETRIVAVVGSFGKSTTKRATARALQIPVSRLAQRNALSFLAGAILRMRPDQRHGVIEVGIDRKGQMATYARMIRPDIAIVTSIGSEHHRSLGSLEVTRAEKAEMVKVLPISGFAVLNGDDPNVRWMAGETPARVVTFGMAETNDVRASDLRLLWPYGTRFTLHLNGERRNVTVRLLGRPMIYPVLAAIATALAEGFTLDDILPALGELSPTPGRLEPILLANGAYILRDDFKSPLETIHAALDLLSEIPAKRCIVVLGEVSEPPGSQGPIYRDIGERLATMASRAIFIGGSFQPYAAGARRGGLPPHSLANAKRSVLQAIQLLREDLGPGDVVLIKGRSTQRLDRIALSLMGRQVQCDITFCDSKIVRCAECPMLERGGDWLSGV